MCYTVVPSIFPGRQTRYCLSFFQKTDLIKAVVINALFGEGIHCGDRKSLNYLKELIISFNKPLSIFPKWNSVFYRNGGGVENSPFMRCLPFICSQTKSDKRYSAQILPWTLLWARTCFAVLFDEDQEPCKLTRGYNRIRQHKTMFAGQKH